MWIIALMLMDVLPPEGQGRTRIWRLTASGPPKSDSVVVSHGQLLKNKKTLTHNGARALARHAVPPDLPISNAQGISLADNEANRFPYWFGQNPNVLVHARGWFSAVEAGAGSQSVAWLSLSASGSLTRPGQCI